MKQFIVAVSVMLFIANVAEAQMRITEWMYNGKGTSSVGEFVEFTNIGSSAIDMSGWSFDDGSRTAGSQSLSAFGTVSPGESVLFTDATDADFRTNWGLSASVKVIGGNTNNLGRADEINLFDASANLVDRLTYDDQTILNCPRTSNISGNPTSLADLGTNNAGRWVLSSVAPADRYGSYTAALTEIGNPGVYVDVVPEPATIMVLLSGMFMIGILSRFRRN
jgi:predicted extracellular nuclease